MDFFCLFCHRLRITINIRRRVCHTIITIHVAVPITIITMTIAIATIAAAIATAAMGITTIMRNIQSSFWIWPTRLGWMC